MNTVDVIVGFLVVSILSFFAGVGVHDLYVGDLRTRLWREAVERGYAVEVETSSGKGFMWRAVSCDTIHDEVAR